MARGVSLPEGGFNRRRVETELSQLDICVLSEAEAGRLEHYGIWPSCKNHRHVKRQEALDAVTRDETHRFVGGPDTKVAFVSAIMPVNTTRIWSTVQCHNAEGMLLRGMKTWGFQPLQ